MFYIHRTRLFIFIITINKEGNETWARKRLVEAERFEREIILFEPYK